MPQYNWCAHCLPQLGFWFLMIIGWHSGYLEADCPADWYVIFSFMIKDWTWYRKSSWQVDMSGERGHSTWSCLRILCWDPPNVYLCFVWSQIQKSATGRSCFGGDMATHCGSEHTNFNDIGMIGRYYLHSDIPNTFLYAEWGHTKKSTTSPKCTISIFGNLPLDPRAHISLISISFFNLNEISTKHCHTTAFRKPLTKATQLIDPEIM